MSSIALQVSEWQRLVLKTCSALGVATPNGREWDALTSQWSPGKSALSSVDELQALRAPAKDSA